MTLLNMFPSKSLGSWVVSGRSPDNVAWHMSSHFLTAEKEATKEKVGLRAQYVKAFPKFLRSLFTPRYLHVKGLYF